MGLFTGLGILGGLTTGALIANAVSSGAEMAQNQYNADMTRKFNREEAEKNRTFQKEMAQNNIKYAVNQANDLGISPSLVLGQQTNALGGSQASVGNPPSANYSGFRQLASVLQDQIKINAQLEMNEDRLQAQKEINEDRLQAQKDIARMKMSNTATQGYTHNYTKDDFKNIFDDLDKVEI